MSDQSRQRGPEPRKHEGVHPGSTTQNKAQRQKQMENRPNKESRMAEGKPEAH